jgi:hypothetical protein
MWYCPHILGAPKRIKENVIACPTIWADLDYCNPDHLLVPPSLTIQSSPDRYQALWRLADAIPPLEAEHIAKRIAYFHLPSGADKSGWDLSQLLRIPYTTNFKYGNQQTAPMVEVIGVAANTFSVSDFDVYPDVAREVAITLGEIPLHPESSDDVLMRHRHTLTPMSYILLNNVPKEGDWSTALWNLQLILFENGLTPEEVFSVCLTAKCNKYARDNRGPEALWQDIARAKRKYESDAEQRLGISINNSEVKPLLTDFERASVESDNTIIEDYITWAASVVDAPPQYHQAGAFTILSAIMASDVKLPASHGTVQPNLWFMILADTTLTRKTTSMDMAMDMLQELEPEAILGTDGTIEGIFDEMSIRPGKASVFLKDELTGFLDSVAKKDYLSGMIESLTKLYDGKLMKRVLSKRSVTVRNPVFIIFSGGIKSKVYKLLNYDQVTSGFIPRFVFITADADVTKVKPIGPPTEQDLTVRNTLLNRLREMHKRYSNTMVSIVVDGVPVGATKKSWSATMTPNAWREYNRYEAEMLMFAQNHANSEIMLPCVSRLCQSGLKAALLIAASRMVSDEIEVTELDMLHAFFYVDIWRNYLLEVLANIGKNAYETQLELIVSALKKAGPAGMLRGEIMRQFGLTKRAADDVIDTLHQRFYIERVGQGRQERITFYEDPEK